MMSKTNSMISLEMHKMYVDSAIKILEEKARNRATIYYNDFCSNIGLNSMSLQQRETAKVLADVTESRYNKYNAMISALVVSAVTQMPSEKFYNLAAEKYGFTIGANERQKLQFWREQKAKLYNYSGNVGPRNEEPITYGQTEVNTNYTQLSFDDSSVLHFYNKKIIISKSRNSSSHDLLLTIFKDKEKVWSYDEVAADWTDEYDKSKWRRYYNAGYEANQKIAKETTIKDFLLLSSKTVNINPRYL